MAGSGREKNVNAKGITIAAAAAVGLIAVGFMLEPTQAVQGAASPIYVLNVKKVFDASPKFKAQADGLKADMDKKENELRALQNAIQAKTQQRAQFKKPAEQEPIEKEINELQFTFAKKQRQYREELSKAESQMV